MGAPLRCAVAETHARAPLSALAMLVLVGVAAVTLVEPTAVFAGQPGFNLGDNTDYALPGAKPVGPGGAEPVDSASLIENANAWNGKLVSFKAEAIGERMVRGSMAWIHANDDAYMDKNIEEGAKLGGYNSGQAIWLPAELARRITHFGDYKHEGDIITVAGTFNAACRQHGGDMDIHATRLQVIRAGHPIAHVFNTGRATLAGILFGIAALFWWLRRGALRRRI